MNSRAKRKQEEQIAESLVLSRIREPKSAAAETVRELLDLLLRAERVRLTIVSQAGMQIIRSGLRPAPAFRLGSCVKFATPALRSLNAQYSDHVMNVNELLLAQSWTPQLRDNDLDGMVREYQSTSPGEEEAWMTAAMNWLLRQAQGSGEGAAHILRFEACKWCAKLFYKGADHQNYCGTKCYEKYKRQSPESKKKRRDYMRDKYRPAQKARQEAEQQAWSRATRRSTDRVSRRSSREIAT